MTRKLFCIGLLCMFAVLSGCGSQAKTAEIKRPVCESDELQFQTPSDGDPIAVFDTSLGEIRAVLYPDQAPMATANFIGLAQEGYYDGLFFHRVVYGFVAQSGDHTGTGLSGGSIWHNNPYPMEYTDQLHHYSGALGMAHAGGDANQNTCLSQYYFVQSLPTLSHDLKTALENSGWRQEVIDAYNTVGGLPYLDNQYTVFGQVYRGMEVVDAIGAVETNEQDVPLTEVLVNHVTISSYSAEEEAAIDNAAAESANSKP